MRKYRKSITLIVVRMMMVMIALLIFLPQRIEEGEEDLFTEIISLYQIVMMVVMTVLTISSKCLTEGGKGTYH